MAGFFARLSQAFQKDKTSSPPQTTFGVGSMIDQHYRLDVEIGRGGMGVVYRAYDMLNDRDVAVKVINSTDDRSIQQFMHEVDIMLRLKHPHVVTVYETGAVNVGAGVPLPFIAMELVQGTCMSEMSRFTYARVVQIAKQICDALEYAHTQGFAYRDLKPGNVMLEKRGFEYFVKLLDFGLARPRGEAYLPSESHLAGTAFYLAPELINGQPADIGSDLYALGATLYEMVTGRVPFFDVDEKTILSQHVNEAVRPPSQSRSDIPPALEEIILHLLEKDPKDRFASAQEVSEALERVTFTDASVAHGNLPDALSAGREEDVAKVTQVLESNQLVTLLNEDHELALAVGIRLKNICSEGVWLVDLHTVSEPGAVLRAVMNILGVTENPNRPLAVSLVEWLREKNLLLVFDHCTHVLGACAQLAATTLRDCPDVRMLVVSDQPLKVSFEKLYKGSDKTAV